VGIVAGVRGLVDKLTHRQIVIIASKHGAVYEVGFFCTPILQSSKKIIGVWNTDMGQSYVGLHWQCERFEFQDVAQSPVRIWETEEQIAVLIVCCAGDNLTIRQQYVHLAHRLMHQAIAE
ncbi:uncharacterized protein METZ01_LOCUS85058, partial [marine metagenome]